MLKVRTGHFCLKFFFLLLFRNHDWWWWWLGTYLGLQLPFFLFFFFFLSAKDLCIYYGDGEEYVRCNLLHCSAFLINKQLQTLLYTDKHQRQRSGWIRYFENPTEIVLWQYDYSRTNYFSVHRLCVVPLLFRAKAIRLVELPFLYGLLLRDEMSFCWQRLGHCYTLLITRSQKRGDDGATMKRRVMRRRRDGRYLGVSWNAIRQQATLLRLHLTTTT